MVLDAHDLRDAARPVLEPTQTPSPTVRPGTGRTHCEPVHRCARPDSHFAVVGPLDADLDVDGVGLVLDAASVSAGLVAQGPRLIEDRLRTASMLRGLGFAEVASSEWLSIEAGPVWLVIATISVEPATTARAHSAILSVMDTVVLGLMTAILRRATS